MSISHVGLKLHSAFVANVPYNLRELVKYPEVNKCCWFTLVWPKQILRVYKKSMQWAFKGSLSIWEFWDFFLSQFLLLPKYFLHLFSLQTVFLLVYNMSATPPWVVLLHEILLIMLWVDFFFSPLFKIDSEAHFICGRVLKPPWLFCMYPTWETLQKETCGFRWPWNQPPFASELCTPFNWALSCSTVGLIKPCGCCGNWGNTDVVF